MRVAWRALWRSGHHRAYPADFIIFVEQSVPDRIFRAVAVGLSGFVGTSRWFVDAGVRDKIEQALPFALIQIVLVPGRAIPDRRDFMRGGFSGLRVA